MSPEEIEAEIDLLHPVFIRMLAADYIKLMRELLARDGEVVAAYMRGDIDSTRHHIEKSMQALQDSADGTLNNELKRQWFASRGGLLMFDLIEDAMRCARGGHRHWLTTLPRDPMPKTSPSDIPRKLIEARAAALLTVYGGKKVDSRVADRIAKVLTHSGFETKRGSPKGVTIREWQKDIKKCASKGQARGMSPFQMKRHYYYNLDKVNFSGMALEEALVLLERTCARFASRLIGAGPAKS